MSPRAKPGASASVAAKKRPLKKRSAPERVSASLSKPKRRQRGQNEGPSVQSALEQAFVQLYQHQFDRQTRAWNESGRELLKWVKRTRAKNGLELKHSKRNAKECGRDAVRRLTQLGRILEEFERHARARRETILALEALRRPLGVGKRFSTTAGAKHLASKHVPRGVSRARSADLDNDRTRSTQRTEVAALVGGASFESLIRGLEQRQAALHGANKLKMVAKHWRNTSAERVAGRVAEELHVATFNADALAKGMRHLLAVTGGTTSRSVEDIRVYDRRGGGTSAQLKYNATAPRTASELASKRYAGLQLIAPSDQVKRIRHLAVRRGIDGLGERDYPSLAARVSDRIRAAGVESRPLTRGDALSAARYPRMTGDALVARETLSAVRRTAQVSAATGSAVAALRNLQQVLNGLKSPSEAVGATALVGLESAVTGVAASGVAIAARGAMLRAGASTIARSGAPAAMGFALVDVAKDARLLVEGDIDGIDFARRTAGHALAGGFAWAAAEGGAALGSMVCPGLGTIVGGMAAGLAGGLFGRWLSR